MAAGIAERIRRTRGQRVVIKDVRGQPRWHSLWDGNPAIVRPGEPRGREGFAYIVNCKGIRPHIVEHRKERFVFNENFRAERARIYLADAEKAIGAIHAGQIIIEPNVPSNKPNKQWGRERWAQLVELMHADGIEPVQLGARSVNVVTGARHIVTELFREACAILSTARAAVLPEGGLHHAAAALNVPAVVLFGGFIEPRLTGYTMHRNVFTGQNGHCGNRKPCAHCAEAWEAISPAMVYGQIRMILQERRAA
jgi:ADP-heptose:LPS heptosyltransferase